MRRGRSPSLGVAMHLSSSEIDRIDIDGERGFGLELPRFLHVAQERAQVGSGVRADQQFVSILSAQAREGAGSGADRVGLLLPECFHGFPHANGDLFSFRPCRPFVSVSEDDAGDAAKRRKADPLA